MAVLSLIMIHIYFAIRPDKLWLTRSMILVHVWQYDFEGNDNVLDVYISYLRRQIDKEHGPPLIHTVRCVGFRVVAP